MPKKATKHAAHSGIHSLQSECKAILQKLTAAHQDWVKNTEKAAAKIKAQWAKADQIVKKAKAQKAALKGAGKKTVAHKKQADKLTMAFVQAKIIAQGLKKELSALLPELKAAKAALKRHIAVEKVAAKKIVAAKVKAVKAKKAAPAKAKKAAPAKAKKAAPAKAKANKAAGKSTRGRKAKPVAVVAEQA
jgi:colicin import membrane protein